MLILSISSTGRDYYGGRMGIESLDYEKKKVWNGTLAFRSIWQGEFFLFPFITSLYSW